MRSRDGERRWHARPWLWVLLLVMVGLTISFYTPRRLHEAEGVHLSFHLTDWRLGFSETRETIDDFGVLGGPSVTFLSKGLHFARFTSTGRAVSRSLSA